MHLQNGNITGYVVNDTRLDNQYHADPTRIFLNSSQIGYATHTHTHTLSLSLSLSLSLCVCVCVKSLYGLHACNATCADAA
jgi:hypothetical protein